VASSSAYPRRPKWLHTESRRRRSPTPPATAQHRCAPSPSRRLRLLRPREHCCDHSLPQLSAREREILDLIARVLDNRSIARRLVLSEKTVRNNVSTILTKLQVADRNQAIVTARDAGLRTTPG